MMWHNQSPHADMVSNRKLCQESQLLQATGPGNKMEERRVYKSETPRCKRAKPKHMGRRARGERRVQARVQAAELLLVCWPKLEELSSEMLPGHCRISAPNRNVDLQLQPLLAPFGICPKFELSVHACVHARVNKLKKAKSLVC